MAAVAVEARSAVGGPLVPVCWPVGVPLVAVAGVLGVQNVDVPDLCGPSNGRVVVDAPVVARPAFRWEVRLCVGQGVVVRLLTRFLLSGRPCMQVDRVELIAIDLAGLECRWGGLWLSNGGSFTGYDAILRDWGWDWASDGAADRECGEGSGDELELHFC